MDLDAALHELGMLSTLTESRAEYLKEMHKDRVLNIVEMNTRFVSNVSIGWKVRPVLSHQRYRPYVTNRRGEERHRTKSENADMAEGIGIVKNVLDDMLLEQPSSSTSDTSAVLKKAKSLESIVLEAPEQVVQFPEIEITNCIQNLKVGE